MPPSSGEQGASEGASLKRPRPCASWPGVPSRGPPGPRRLAMAGWCVEPGRGGRWPPRKQTVPGTHL